MELTKGKFTAVKNQFGNWDINFKHDSGTVFECITLAPVDDMVIFIKGRYPGFNPTDIFELYQLLKMIKAE